MRTSNFIIFLVLYVFHMCSQVLLIKTVNWAFSPAYLAYLAKEEIEIFNLVIEYKNSLPKKMELLERYVQDYNDSTKTGDPNIDQDELKRAKTISAHPLMTYRMIRRFVYDLQEMTKDISMEFRKPFLERLKILDKTIKLPNKKDLINIMDNILRLQNVYELPAYDLINGIIAGRNTSVGLSVPQAFEIGKYAISQEFYTEAFDWIKYVITELQINPDLLQQVNISHVFSSMKKLIKRHNKLCDSNNDLSKPAIALNIFSTKIDQSLNHPLHSLRVFDRQSGDDSPGFAFENICSGDTVQVMKSALYCYFEASVHPMWTIGPLKIEIHSLDPYVYQIYEAIGESAMKYLKYLAIPELDRAKVESGPNKFETSSARTSSRAFLLERSYKLLMDLEKKIEHMIGLKVHNMRSDGKYLELEASEPIQVAVYGFGGHYQEHHDAIQSVKKTSFEISGNRIATFMFYLNDVDHGGHTAFPLLRISVPPIKGSALFWYDLFRNGEVDKRTAHGGCPVVLGEKWIANKWICHHVNFQKRKCSLDPHE